MAQHDYVIANGTGAAVRSDLNNGLAAIVSNNSGATEPATMYAYQWWADTTTGLLKLRNAANSAWVTVGTLASANLGLAALASPTFTGTVTAPTFTASTAVNIPLGSAGSPTLFFTGDTNNGLFSPGADIVALTTDGSERFRIAASGQIGLGGANYGTSGQALTSNGSGSAPTWQTPVSTSDKISEGNTEAEVVDTGSDGHFKVTTEGSERLRVDPSGRLLVGTSTNITGYRTEISTNDGSNLSLLSYSASVGDGVYLVLNRSKSGTTGTQSVVASGDLVGTIRFRASDGTGFINAAAIEAIVDGTPGTNDMPGRLVFSTTADGASSPTERMRLQNTGAFNVFAATGVTVFSSRSATGSGSSDRLFVGTHSATSTTSGTVSIWIYTNGNVENANNSYTGFSDIKLKENIVNASSQWADIKALQVRKYNFKEETGHQTHTQIGLIAQEVELISPGLVSESPDRDEEGNDLGTTTKSVSYSVLYMKAVKALQEAMERIETLEADVAALKAQ